MRKRIILLLASVAIVLCASEFALRMAGFQPYVIEEINDSISGQRYVLDSTLGYSLNPGYVTLNYMQKIKSHYHHCDDKTRASGPECTLPRDPRFSGNIGIYGCSFTYGNNIDDSMTMAWKMKELLPDKNIKNYGVGGYGLGQVYLKILQQEKDGTLPDVIIINYFSGHDERTAFSLRRRKQIVPQYRAADRKFQTIPIDSIDMPYFRLDANSNLQLNYVRLVNSYCEWPFIRHSALVNLAEDAYNNYADEKLNMTEVTFKLFYNLNELCKRHKVNLVFGRLLQDEATNRMMLRCAAIGIDTLNYEVDLADSQFNLQPLDSHPNSLGNTLLARHAVAYINARNR